jgi:uncharacterized protein DUF4232
MGLPLALLAALALHAPAAPPRCHTSELSGHLGRIQGAAGSRFGPLVLVNRSAHRCTLRGFIGGRLLGADGRRLPTRIVRDRSTPVRTVLVAPGGVAVSVIRWSTIPSGGATSCPTPRMLAVTPPDARATLPVRWRAGPVCGGGRIDVRALRPPAARAAGG